MQCNGVGGWVGERVGAGMHFLSVFFTLSAITTRQVGDWTQDLFRLGLEQPRLPLWITAAQPSLMEKSIYYDNGE